MQTYEPAVPGKLNHAVAPPSKKTGSACATMPSLRRPNYYYGRLLGPREFRGEQEYFLERLRMHNRCLHGYGVVCGLEVTPPGKKPDCPDPAAGDIDALKAKIEDLEKARAGASGDEAAKIDVRIEKLRRELEELGQAGAPAVRQPAGIVDVHCGFAIDCHGNELVLEKPRRVNVWAALSEQDRARFDASSKTVYIAVCFCERPEEPQRPVVFNDCGVTAECQYGWTADSVKVSVFLEGDKPPQSDDRCEICCQSCCEDEAEGCGPTAGAPCCGCLVVARIVNFDKTKVAEEAQVQNWIRRPLTTYVTTKVSGVSWVHAATYGKATIEDVLFPPGDADKGLVVQFTRPVHRSTIKRGTVDVWRIEGGLGQRGNIENFDIALTLLPENSAMVDRIVIRNATDETLDFGDRVLIQVRTTQILDRCCRAVDGENIGGRVPVLPEFADASKAQIEDAAKENGTDCLYGRPFGGPWQSGNQVEGGDFVSWFYCEQYQRKGGGTAK